MALPALRFVNLEKHLSSRKRLGNSQVCKKLLNPKDESYQIVYLGEYDRHHVYYYAPLRYVGCVGFPIFVLEKDGVARWADRNEEQAALMQKFYTKL